MKIAKRRTPGWTWPRIIGGISALTLIGVLVACDAWADIYHIAMSDEESSHVFLVPFVVAYLIWVRRRRLRHVQPNGFWIGPILVALGWFCYRLGDTRLWQSVWQGGAIFIAIGCLLTAYGGQIARQLIPAFLVLVFLIPVPGRVRQRIAIPMQNATARVTQGLFDLADVPVTRAGNLLSMNGVDVAIAEACNGLRMVFALVLVCYAFAFGNPLRPYARVLIIAASPLAAIICNVARLVPTVYVYGHFSTEFADLFHVISGWFMLFVAFLMLIGILRLLRWALIPVTQFTLASD